MRKLSARDRKELAEELEKLILRHFDESGIKCDGHVCQAIETGSKLISSRVTAWREVEA
jgi:hypothetical protein